MRKEEDNDDFCVDYNPYYNDMLKPKKFFNNVFIFGLLNLVWFLFRTGRKPSRIVYPCQQEALKNVSISLASLIPILSLPLYWKKIKSYAQPILAFTLVISPICGAYAFHSLTSFEEIQLNLEPLESSSDSASNIFVVNGRNVSHVSNLINLMGSYNLSFYLSSTTSQNSSPDGLISSSDVVLLKVNAQWSKRGMTNTDFLKELIQVIVDHPDGFTGEIIVADNGQGSGNLDRTYNNAENNSQSTQDVVDLFSSAFKVSTFLFDDISWDEVDEYSEGNMDDGYIVYDDMDAETGIYVSYPKFETDYGTKVSFKNGIWNGTGYEQKLKVINLPVLKSHSGYGVTATLKNYMGVQTQALANGHTTIATGSMGTLMVELGLPTLNIIDAIWINANPEGSFAEGPATTYGEATRVNILIAGLDPVALDYWSSKYILVPTSESIGYSNTDSLDPDKSDSSGLSEAFGIWLNLTEEELLRAGYNVTSDEDNMNVYIIEENEGIETPGTNRKWLTVGLSTSGAIMAIAIAYFVIRRRRLSK